MPTSDTPTTVSDKQRAATRANAANSTGPRTPEGKARSAQNARRHGFTASVFAVVRLEGPQAVAHLKADLVAAYQPVNSQELIAIERLAIAQQCLFRAAALESGLFSTCLNISIGDENHPVAVLHPDLTRDLEVTRLQNRNILLAEGFQRMTYKKSPTWELFLRYQFQCERHYRRAIQDFDRLKTLRSEMPNKPIFDPHPEENESLADPETNPFPDSEAPPGAAPAANPAPIRPSSPQPVDPAPGSNQIGFVPQNAPAEPRAASESATTDTAGTYSSITRSAHPNIRTSCRASADSLRGRSPRSGVKRRPRALTRPRTNSGDPFLAASPGPSIFRVLEDHPGAGAAGAAAGGSVPRARVGAESITGLTGDADRSRFSADKEACRVVTAQEHRSSGVKRTGASADKTKW